MKETVAKPLLLLDSPLQSREEGPQLKLVDVLGPPRSPPPPPATDSFPAPQPSGDRRPKTLKLWNTHGGGGQQDVGSAR